MENRKFFIPFNMTKTGVIDPLSRLMICLVLVSGCKSPDSKWETLFNGEDLSGWQELNGKHLWKVQDGMIVGTTVPNEPNGFLCTKNSYADFVLELEVSIDTLMNNSGVQFRTQSTSEYKNGRVHGYQMEIDPKPQQWSGAIYEEGGIRGWLFPDAMLSKEAKQAFKRDTKSGFQWNHYRIECIGTSIKTWVNGVPAAHLIDDKFPEGFIGLQLHANGELDPEGSFSVRFRNIKIQVKDLNPSPPNVEVRTVDLISQN